MSWATPKNDWDTADAVGSADMNRIEENTITLHKGNGQAALADATVASGELTFANSIEETYYVIGSGDIDFISTIGRQPGNRIHLIINVGTIVEINNNTASPPANFESIYVHSYTTGFSDIAVYQNQLLTLVLSETHWHCNI